MFRRMPFYAVANGFKVGIFDTWAECQKATNGFPGARFKKFNTKEEAQCFITANKPATSNVSLLGSSSGSFNSGDQKFYVVARGDKPGIYTNWDECQQAIGYYPFPKFRKFSTLPTAEAFLNENVVANLEKDNRKRSLEEAREDPKRMAMDVGDDIPTVYTDGACSNNGTPDAGAGYGIFWGNGHADNVAAPVSGAPTNNRAEYEAVCVALEQAKTRGYKTLKILTDSKLLVNSVTKWLPGWKRNNWKKSNGEVVLNRDLLERIDGMTGEIDVRFEHVAGHAGIHGNEMADSLAREGARLYLQAKRRMK